MKKLIVFFIIVIIPLSLLSKADFQHKQIQNDPLVVPTNAPIVNISTPYTIESLRERKYTKKNITIENEAYKNDKFIAYVISYYSDDLKLYALMSVPKDIEKKKIPILILNHGYIDPQNYSTIESYRNPFDYFAKKGFIVLKPDYRANGNSAGDRQDPLNRLNYPIDVLNLIASIPSLNSLPIFSSSSFLSSPHPLFLWGHSMGGDVTLKVAEVLGNKIQKVSLWAPVSAPYPESMLYFLREKRDPHYEKTKALVYKFFTSDDFIKLSPSENTHLIKAPIILHHGTADNSVPYVWSVDLDKKLTQNNIQHIFYTYKDDDHNFSRGAHETVLKRDFEFFTSN